MQCICPADELSFFLICLSIYIEDPLVPMPMPEPQASLPQSFLSDVVWVDNSPKHIRVALGPTVGNGKRHGFTTVPIQFDDIIRPSKVLLYYTNNKGRWIRELRPLDDLKPSPPLSGGKDTLILTGAHRGRILPANKVLQKAKKVAFIDGSERWEESHNNVCEVISHTGRGCDCQKAS